MKVSEAMSKDVRSAKRLPAPNQHKLLVGIQSSGNIAISRDHKGTGDALRVISRQGRA